MSLEGEGVLQEVERDPGGSTFRRVIRVAVVEAQTVSPRSEIGDPGGSACRRVIRVAVAEAQTVAPRSEIVFAGVLGDSACSAPLLVEPAEPLDTSGLVVARAVVTPQNGKVLVRVVEPTGHAVCVHAGGGVAMEEPTEPLAVLPTPDPAASTEVPGRVGDLCEAVPAREGGRSLVAVLSVLAVCLFAVEWSCGGRFGPGGVVRHIVEEAGTPRCLWCSVGPSGRFGCRRDV